MMDYESLLIDIRNNKPIQIGPDKFQIRLPDGSYRNIRHDAYRSLERSYMNGNYLCSVMLEPTYSDKSYCIDPYKPTINTEVLLKQEIKLNKKLLLI